MHRSLAAALAVSALLVLGAARAGAEQDAGACAADAEAGTNYAVACDGGDADTGREPASRIEAPDEDDMSCSCWWGAAPGGTAALLLFPAFGTLLLRRRKRPRRGR